MVDAAASYIHIVQYLIEKCLVLRMTREECVEALCKHANIKPIITSTVWNELEKENKQFFDTYAREMDTVIAVKALPILYRIIDEDSGDSDS